MENLEPSIAFKAGQEAKRLGIKLENSAVRNLRVGSKQYEDFISGFDFKCVDGGNCGCGGYCEKCVLSQPLNFKDAEMNEFYLQDSRSYVGNDLLFWAKNGKGYTTDLRLAEVYSKDIAERMHQAREADISWPKDYIDNNADFDQYIDALA